MNQLLKCPNKKCKYHAQPERKMFKGKGTHQRNGKEVQRYQCRACGRSFCQNSIGVSTYFRKDVDLVKDIFTRYTSGYTLANLSRDLHISKKTALRYLEELAGLCRRYHQAYLSHGFLRTRFVFLDEMETFVISKKYPYSISLAVDTGYNRIICAYTHEIKTKGKLKAEVVANPEKFFKALLQRYNSPKANEKAMRDIKKCLIPVEAKIYSDAKPEYITLIQKHFPQGVEHIGEKFNYKDVENLPPYVLRYGAIQAWLRTNASRLGRRTQITSKKRSFLEDHLILMIARYNKYPLDEVLNFDRHEHDFYEYTKKQKEKRKKKREENPKPVREYRWPKKILALYILKRHYHPELFPQEPTQENIETG